jgi:hypothetical protein
MLIAAQNMEVRSGLSDPSGVRQAFLSEARLSRTVELLSSSLIVAALLRETGQRGPVEVLTIRLRPSSAKRAFHRPDELVHPLVHLPPRTPHRGNRFAAHGPARTLVFLLGQNCAHP